MSGVQEAGSSSSHKEGSVSRKRRDEKDVNKLISIIDRNMINPFHLHGITDDSEPIALCNIAGGTVPGEDITEVLLGAYEKGFKRINDLLKERLNTNKVSFFEAQTKLKLKTFSSIRKPGQSKKNGKIESFSIDRELFGRLLVISKTREVNLREIFSYELSNTPLSLSCPDGTLHKAVKSKLLEEIEKEAAYVKSIPHSQEKIAWVIDGMALIQMVKAGNATTFGELLDNLFEETNC